MTQASYNALPYPNACYTQTHPDRLATIATLLGLTPASVAGCDVLEFGAAGGGNLIPLAYALPQSNFVGVDYAVQQVRAGQEAIDALGLENVHLLHADILDLDGDRLGRFDYIIAHGIYSWTPPAVRDRLLALCRQLLRPNGVAFVSYNTYPGWHNLMALREMMQFHTREIEDLSERAAESQQFVGWLAETTASEGAFGQFVQSYHNMLQLRGAEGAAYLAHDELEQINEPLYFYQFIEHAGRHDLHYLADADFASVMLSNYSPDVARRLVGIADGSLLRLEQYSDFVRNRTLRQTLLVHADVVVGRELQPDALLQLHIAAGVGVNVLMQDDVATFTATDEARLATNHPVSMAALRHLCAIAPAAVPFTELLAHARTRVQQAGAQLLELGQDGTLLAATLLQAYCRSSKLIELHTEADRFTSELSAQPLASRLAAWQAQHGYHKVSSLRHERVSLDTLSRRMLMLLDGTRTREQCLQQLVADVAAGELAVRRNGNPLSAHATIARALAVDCDNVLQFLARAALLER